MPEQLNQVFLFKQDKFDDLNMLISQIPIKLSVTVKCNFKVIPLYVAEHMLKYEQTHILLALIMAFLALLKKNFSKHAYLQN